MPTELRSTRVQHQDLFIYRYMDQGRQFHRVAIYLRKEDGKFDRLREFVVHFNHASIMLPDASIYGVVFSSARRMAGRCSWGTEWKEGMAKILHHMFELEYDWGKVWQQVKKFFVQFDSLELLQQEKWPWYWYGQLRRAMQGWDPKAKQGEKRSRQEET